MTTPAQPYPPPPYPPQPQSQTAPQNPVPQDLLPQNPVASKPRRTWLRWAVPVATFVLGLMIGVAGGGGTAADPAAPAAQAGDSEVAALEAQVADREAELEAAQAELDARAADLDAREADLADREAALSAEPAEPAPAAPPAGSYTAGSYTFNDAQVSADFVDDFSLRARVTNNGSARSSVAFTVTFFSGGSMVGTGTGMINEFEPGATQTIEFMSTDDYQDWDTLEFQVEFEL